MEDKPLIDVVCGLIKKDSRTFWARKKPGQTHEGLWEMPGGKIQSGETLFRALQRELQEEFGMEIVLSDESPISIEHDAYRLWLLPVYWQQGPDFLIDHDACGWFTSEEWPLLPMNAHEKTLAQAYFVDKNLR